MVVNGRPMKRVKRRVTADLYDFLTFPAAANVPTAPFRSSVRDFISNHALLPPPSSLLPHLLAWQILFRVGELNAAGDDVVCLDVVEEDVARSRSIYCDQCRVVGWSNNPVCTKRYHFIIKADGNSIGGYNKSCAACGDVLHLSESSCKSCNHVMTTEDVEDWMYHQLEDTTHLLHGVIHANGFGHLLRVNGREGGSRLLSGSQIMSFWDRLCIALGVRKVSVMDVSKKFGLEFRLLHAVIKGHPWYGDWGYYFCSGSFGRTHDAYKTAVENLSSIPLNLFLSQGRKPHTRMQDLISFYQSLSDRQLVNIRDLISFLMSLIHDTRKSSHQKEAEDDEDATCKKPRCSESRVLSAWTSRDIARVEEAMIRVLRAVTGSNWVSWRALKGAVCKVGPPDLLDYCLKELNGKEAANGLVVNARCIPDSGSIDFRLEPRNKDLNVNTTCNGPHSGNHPSEEHLLRDLRYLYESMLQPETMCFIPYAKRDLAISSATTLVDCKQFMKDYQPEKYLLVAKPHSIQLMCEVDLKERCEERAMNLPPELLILSCDATISDLKLEASRAFQEVYLIFRRFLAEELIGYGGVDESTQVKLLLGSAEFVRIRGRCMGRKGLGRFKMERGMERWTVDCSCGAKDDDGERMLACDGCGVWQHTRCAGISDLDAVPTDFICCRCSSRYVGQVTNVYGMTTLSGVAAAAAAVANAGFGKGLATNGVW